MDPTPGRTKGEWRKWRFDDDKEVFILVGKKSKKSKNVDGKVYFDCVLCRRLYISGHEIPKGVWAIATSAFRFLIDIS